MGKPKRDVDELREEIEAIVLRESADFFDDAESRDALEVTVRICCEFYNFLVETKGDDPDASEARYVAQTIRSGMDQYYTMEQFGRILSGLKLQEGFSSSGKLPQTFVALKTEYEANFRQVLDCDASAKAFGLLLSLTRLMLLFLTVYFQSFQSYSAGDASSNGD
jgi:hypothetical protein